MQGAIELIVRRTHAPNCARRRVDHSSRGLMVDGPSRPLATHSRRSPDAQRKCRVLRARIGRGMSRMIASSGWPARRRRLHGFTNRSPCSNSPRHVTQQKTARRTVRLPLKNASFETGDDVPCRRLPQRPIRTRTRLRRAERSRPSRSASSLTRRPTVYFTIRNASSATTLDSTTVISTPCAWIHTCAAMS